MEVMESSREACLLLAPTQSEVGNGVASAFSVQLPGSCCW